MAEEQDAEIDLEQYLVQPNCRTLEAFEQPSTFFEAHCRGI